MLSGIDFALSNISIALNVMNFASKYRFRHVGWREKYLMRAHLDIPWPYGVPTDYYRDWLEANCGKQGIRWEWEIASRRDNEANTMWLLKIKFRSAKDRTHFALTFS